MENAFHFGRIDDDTITLSLAGDGLDPGPAVGIGERNGNDKDYDGEYPDSCSGPSRTRWKAKLRDFRPLNCRILRTQFQGKRIQVRNSISLSLLSEGYAPISPGGSRSTPQYPRVPAQIPWPSKRSMQMYPGGIFSYPRCLSERSKSSGNALHGVFV